MFSLTVCDHIMVAHSFRGAVYGPAQRLHGTTFAVEATFRAPGLDPFNALVEIALLRAELRRVLDGLDYRNLDGVAELAGENTTAEYMAFHIHTRLAEACRSGALGPHAGGIVALQVLLQESPVAWAAYEAPV